MALHDDSDHIGDDGGGHDEKTTVVEMRSGTSVRSKSTE